ncbi:hypothetical protein Taro_030701, partial [Colocasia esculenta]|nr:hypothetical protein [Colocasia esculenta]
LAPRRFRPDHASPRPALPLSLSNPPSLARRVCLRDPSCAASLPRLHCAPCPCSRACTGLHSRQRPWQNRRSDLATPSPPEASPATDFAKSAPHKHRQVQRLSSLPVRNLEFCLLSPCAEWAKINLMVNFLFTSKEENASKAIDFGGAKHLECGSHDVLTTR